jgi:uncharacterized damage-inducible protein DinB
LDPTTIGTLIDYNEWANGRLLTAAAEVDETELRRDRSGAGHGSIWGQLHHIAYSQIALRLACLGKIESPMQAPQAIAESGRFDFDTREGLWRAFETSHADLRELRAMLSPEVLALRVSREPRFESLTRGDAVLQLLTHAAHHRGETAMLLSEIGRSPGDLDYIFFALERRTSRH